MVGFLKRIELRDGESLDVQIFMETILAQFLTGRILCTGPCTVQ